MARKPISNDETRPLLVDGNHAKYASNERLMKAADEPSDWQCFKIMMGVWLGSFLAALDQTVMATLSTAISDSFDALSMLSWVVSSYIIATAVAQPISGKLADVYGRREGFMLALILFGAGNIICALSPNTSVMILGRIVAGLGGGCLNSISTFITSDLIPLRRRGLWQGIGNFQYGVGLALGGVIGGIINDFAGWRWAFWFQVPLVILCAVPVWFGRIPVKDNKGSKGSTLLRVDFLGSFTLTTSLVLLLVPLNSGGNTVPWTHPLVTISLPLSLLFLLIFVIVETKVPEPIIPMDQLRKRTVLAACFTNWFGTMTAYNLIFFMPIYFQVRGNSTSIAGLRMLPLSFGLGIGALIVGYGLKIWGRYYWLNVVIMTPYLVSLAALSTLQLDSPIWLVLTETFVASFGHASILVITLTAFVAAVDHQYQAVITAASYAFRSTGGSIGVAIGSAVFHHVVYTELWHRLGARDGANVIIPKLMDRLEYSRSLEMSWQEPVLEIYMYALRHVFLIMLATAGLAALCSLCMKEHKLYANLARRDSSSS